MCDSGASSLRLSTAQVLIVSLTASLTEAQKTQAPYQPQRRNGG